MRVIWKRSWLIEHFLILNSVIQLYAFENYRASVVNCIRGSRGISTPQVGNCSPNANGRGTCALYLVVSEAYKYIRLFKVLLTRKWEGYRSTRNYRGRCSRSILRNPSTEHPLSVRRVRDLGVAVIDSNWVHLFGLWSCWRPGRWGVYMCSLRMLTKSRIYEAHMLHFDNGITELRRTPEWHLKYHLFELRPLDRRASNVCQIEPKT